jgi:hypothetical protein
MLSFYMGKPVRQIPHPKSPCLLRGKRTPKINRLGGIIRGVVGDVDVALAHIQEILTDEQLEREFYWGTSEIAYPYNPTTKQSKFSPLTRPYFMAAPAPQLKRIQIPRGLMPVGEGIDSGGMEKYIAENPVKKVDPEGSGEGLQDM